MASVLVRLKKSEWTLEEASELADSLVNVGKLEFTNNAGATVNVEVDDVTVEA